MGGAALLRPAPGRHPVARRGDQPTRGPGRPGGRGAGPVRAGRRRLPAAARGDPAGPEYDQGTGRDDRRPAAACRARRLGGSAGARQSPVRHQPGARATARELAAWVIGGPKRRALGLACGGLAAAETGDLREAERLLGRARHGLDGRDWAYFFLYTRYGEAVLAWHAGRAAECADTLAEVAAALIGMDATAVSVFVLIDLAESAADAHDGRAASSAARQLEDVARAAGLAPHRGLAAAAAAWAALESGRPDVAVAQAAEAVGLLSKAGWRSHLGRAHDVLGRSLGAAGQPGAVAELDLAAGIFTQCGAAWRRDRT